MAGSDLMPRPHLIDVSLLSLSAPEEGGTPEFRFFNGLVLRNHL